MSRSIYIASTEGETGKSAIALGIVDTLGRSVGKVGVFRPVIRALDGTDHVLRLLLSRTEADLDYDDCVGVTYEAIHQDPEAALTTIISRYHVIQKQCDVVVIVGTDHTDVAGPAEFEFNARIAANLGAPVALVVNGRDRTPAEITQIVDSATLELDNGHAHLVAVFANRCDPDNLEAIRKALPSGMAGGAIPEDPLLAAPLLRDLMESVGGELYAGDPDLLTREVLGVTIGAMSVDHLLDRLREGRVVITPGDRADSLLAVLSAHAAAGFPTIAGVILNGGFLPSESMNRLLSGLDSNLPIITTSLWTFETATRCYNTRGRLTHESSRKLDTALALFERHIDTAALRQLISVAETTAITPLMFEYDLLDRARADKRHIVLPEGEDDRILRAASSLLTRDVVDLTLLGDEASIRARAAELGVNIAGAKIVSPTDPRLVKKFAKRFHELRAHKGVTLDIASELVKDVSYFGTMMVEAGLADGMVSGAAHTTAHTITPALQVIKTPPGVGIVSSVFLMCLGDRVLVYGDCAINPDPTAEQLADIAISSAATAAQFRIEPRVAMLSYSTGESGTGSDVDKVRSATKIVRKRRSDLAVEGPIQYDAAIEPSVAKTKMPDSKVAGRATVFIFPDLNTGNNTYKAVQRSAGAVAIGPVLQGLKKPVNDLSRGATVNDIINTVAITAIQAQQVDATPPAEAPPAKGKR
ncbi:MAG: phosphate acetyltransferase [Demequinaceae bacterium]|nr:phosphate acetyltransferase [Demequinaceae bacterium]